MNSQFQFEDQHPMFAGHFPDHPIVPGVMLLQQVELLVLAEYPAYEISKVIQVKFLQTVAPNENIAIDIVEVNKTVVNTDTKENHGKVIDFKLTTNDNKKVVAQGRFNLEQL